MYPLSRRKKTWWWNEAVQESIQRNRLAKKKWDSQGDAKSIQEYWEAMHTAKRGVAKERTLSALYVDTKKRKKDLYQLASKRLNWKGRAGG